MPMPSFTLITVIIVLLVALVAYALTVQALTQRRQYRDQQLSALKSRARNFAFMLNGFPNGFLPKALLLLVQRSLIQVLEQLQALEPSQSAHKDDLQAVAQQMTITRQDTPSDSVPPVISDPQQIRAIRVCLEDLYKFILRMERQQILSRSHANACKALIRHLALRLTADAYVLQGQEAQDKEKPRLALHYYHLALNTMNRENTGGLFNQRLAVVHNRLEEAEDLLARQETQTAPNTEEAADQAAIAQEWNSFAQEPAWKKKQIYD